MRVFLHIARNVHFYGSGKGERVKKVERLKDERVRKDETAKR